VDDKLENLASILEVRCDLVSNNPTGAVRVGSSYSRPPSRQSDSASTKRVPEPCFSDAWWVGLCAVKAVALKTTSMTKLSGVESR
jgi:hypothetical protein